MEKCSIFNIILSYFYLFLKINKWVVLPINLTTDIIRWSSEPNSLVWFSINWACFDFSIFKYWSRLEVHLCTSKVIFRTASAVGLNIVYRFLGKVINICCDWSWSHKNVAYEVYQALLACIPTILLNE